MLTSPIIPVVWAILEQMIDGVKYVLIQTRRKPWTDFHWTLESPVWRIEQWESVCQWLLREIHEESGLTVSHINTQVSFTWADSTGFSPVYCTQQLRKGLPWVMVGFVCQAEWTAVQQQSETRDPHWITLTQLAEYLDAGRIFDLEVPFFRYYLSIHDTITFEPVSWYDTSKSRDPNE